MGVPCEVGRGQRFRSLMIVNSGRGRHRQAMKFRFREKSIEVNVHLRGMQLKLVGRVSTGF